MGSSLSVKKALRLAVALAAASGASGVAAARADCARDFVKTHVAGAKHTHVYRAKGAAAITYTSGLAIDADGAPDAYHPRGAGIDDNANAGAGGRWWGVVTRGGRPLVQRAGAYSGYYVSQTWLHREDGHFSENDPQYWVDARAVPYIAIPKSVFGPTGIDRGDLAMVVNERNGRRSYAIVADWGTDATLGEGSIALARALGVPANPRTGGQASGISYVAFPGSGSRPRWPREESDMAQRAEALYAEWKREACE
jgi:hypothetical protein